jgi:hypothetical protein
MTTTAADSQAIKEHVAKDHTRQCAEHMVLEKGQCECEWRTSSSAIPPSYWTASTG